ncbi:polysaccharide deacetylase family protein [Gillisia sp. Hel_I_29]|uniref:polysaccharide deacetylase family protein n=1 Tax=Gillisia sp. Hel_I_29 TaxID=1249975 RepID=UPI000556EE8F|nr:polysaccharide deacetylase family protein [Gillisia sp. Hel_I_29]
MKSKSYKFLNFISNLFLPESCNLRVLAYHDIIDSNKFEAQIKFLVKSKYNIISVNDLHAYLYDGKILTKNSLLITFDDGDVSVLDHGLPILRKYDLPSVMFVITGLINSANTFWCRWVEIALQNQGKSYAESRVVVNSLKKMSNSERVAYLEKLDPVASRQLTIDDMLKMQNGKMFIGNHTHTHPMVNKCTNQELNNDLKLSLASFEEWQLPGGKIFAYPNGNWDKESEEILKNNGIDMAFLFDHKLNKKDINPMRISRIRVNSDTELNEFKVKISGLHSKLMTLKNRIV